MKKEGKNIKNRTSTSHSLLSKKTLDILVILIIVLGFSIAIYEGYMYGLRKGALSTMRNLGRCKVLIIDQLEDDYPNPHLIGNMTAELEKANCTVTLIPADEFTINSLNLFKYYNVIIFRGHTGWANVYNPATGSLKVYVALFTGERYSPDLYPKLQEKGYIAEGIPLVKPRPHYNKTYIAVTQYYLEKYLQVKRGSVIILSTCFAGYKVLAGIFLDKGASLVVGWRGNVTVMHADKVLEEIVKNYVKYRSWDLAIKMLPQSYTRDPFTGASLVVYSNRH